MSTFTLFFLTVQETLIKSLCVNRALGITFYLYLSGAIRFRAQYGTNKKQIWWYTNKYMKRIKSENKSVFNDILTSWSLFSGRVCPMIYLPQPWEIDDSLEITCKYFAMAFEWIRNLFDTGRAKDSFQIDFCIFYAHANQLQVYEQKAVNKVEHSDIDEEEEDDDDEDDYDYDDSINTLDIIGNIKTKLEQRNLEYKMDKINTKNRELARETMIDLFDRHFKNKCISRSRLITCIDTRGENKDDDGDDESDDIYVYTPSAKDCGYLPKGEIPEIWFHNASQKFLFPDINMCSNFPRLLLLSFHVRNPKEVAIYLCHRESMQRFEPSVCILFELYDLS